MHFYLYTITSFIMQYHCFVLYIYIIYIYITSVLLNIICCPRRRVQPHCHHVHRIPRAVSEHRAGIREISANKHVPHCKFAKLQGDCNQYMICCCLKTCAKIILLVKSNRLMLDHLMIWTRLSLTLR